MTTTRRPKLLKDFATPWGTVYAGVILRPDTYANGDWRLCHTHGICTADINAKPDWFAWVDVCDECDKEACGCQATVDNHRSANLCHGHAASPLYPIPADEYAVFTVSGNGDVNPRDLSLSHGGVYPRWRTYEHARQFSDAVKRLANDMMTQFNAEARR